MTTFSGCGVRGAGCRVLGARCGEAAGCRVPGTGYLVRGTDIIVVRRARLARLARRRRATDDLRPRRPAGRLSLEELALLALLRSSSPWRTFGPLGPEDLR